MLQVAAIKFVFVDSWLYEISGSDLESCFLFIISSSQLAVQENVFIVMWLIF